MHGHVAWLCRDIPNHADSFVIRSKSKFRLTDTYYHTLSCCTGRLRYYVYNDIILCTCICQWIYLREDLQETIDFPMNYGYFFPLHQSIEYIVQLRYYDVRTLALALEELADSMLKSVSSSKPKKSRPGQVHMTAASLVFFLWKRWVEW